jgi:hypothetical protein
MRGEFATPLMLRIFTRGGGMFHGSGLGVHLGVDWLCFFHCEQRFGVALGPITG